MVIVITAVGTSTIIGVVNSHPGTGSHLVHWEGTPGTLEAPMMACPVDKPAFQVKRQTLAPEH